MTGGFALVGAEGVTVGVVWALVLVTTAEKEGEEVAPVNDWVVGVGRAEEVGAADEADDEVAVRRLSKICSMLGLTTPDAKRS
jgi:hypothetical protein